MEPGLAVEEEARWELDPAAQLTEYLFLGGALAAENKHCLQARGITRVLNVADDIDCHYPQVRTPAPGSGPRGWVVWTIYDRLWDSMGHTLNWLAGL
jgi:hypothetical protein